VEAAEGRIRRAKHRPSTGAGAGAGVGVLDRQPTKGST
jgi:hypothetical protein